MKVYFFKYPEISEVIGACFPVRRMFRKKEYRLESNLASRFGVQDCADVIPDQAIFFLEVLKMLMDVDLKSSGYSDFDTVALNIQKRNDSQFEVIFLTDRTRKLYEKRLTEMAECIENGKIDWFKPSQQFSDFVKFLSKVLSQLDSEQASLLLIPM